MPVKRKQPKTRQEEPPLGSIGSMWAGVRRESAGLYCVLGYLLFEYGRPQSIYLWLDFFPFSSAFLLLSLMFAFGHSPGRSLAVPGTGLVAIFTLLVLASSAASYAPELAFGNLYIYINWLLVYFTFVALLNTQRRWLLAMALFLLLSFKMSQHGFRTWVARGMAFTDWGLGGPAGWFENSGELGIQMCVFLPLAIGFVLAYGGHWPRMVRLAYWAMPMSALATIIGSSSRGAVVGGLAALMPMALRSRYKWKALGAIAVISLIGYLVMPPEFIERFNSAGEDGTSVSRLTRWKGGIDMMFDHPLLGVGYFNWPAYYPLHYEPGVRGALLSHNIFVQVGAEMGVTGLMVFLLMIFACLKMTGRIRAVAAANPQAAHYQHLANGLDGALVGYLVSGFFVTVFFYPYFWVNLAFTAALYNVACREADLVKFSAHKGGRKG
jgi:putative inorganic carbon (HCO3(-)) transporter